MLEKKFSKIIQKNNHFLDLGATLLLAYATYESTTLFGHHYTGLTSAIPIALTTTFCLLTIFIGALSLIGHDIKGGALGAIFTKNSLKLNEKQTNKIYYNYNPKELYSQEELKEKKIFTKALNLLIIASNLDAVSKFDGYPYIHEAFDEEAIKSPLIQKLYFKECVEKNSPILSNLFLEALTYQTKKDVSYAKKTLQQLLDLNPQLTESDQKNFAHYLKFKKEKLKAIHPDVIELISQKEYFFLLNKENQKLFLTRFATHVKNRNELIEVFNQENKTTSNSIDNQIDTPNSSMSCQDKPIVINHLSYENFNQFRINCESIYNQSEILEQLLQKIEKVLLFKEKLLSFMDSGNNIETELFLAQDIDKTIHNFNREINILHKMKVMDHPDLETNKVKILDNMSSRITVIIEKMSEQTSLIHQALSDDLNIETEINNKVLKSKV